MTHNCKIEIRETDGRPRLVGTILHEGRAARGGLAEVFEPNSVAWPEEGIGILLQHYGAPETRAVPVREAGGAIRVSVPATPAIVAAVQSGRDQMSVEFHALRETRTAGGVRAIERAFVDGATLTDNAEYPGTAAEIRDRKRRVRTWL